MIKSDFGTVHISGEISLISAELEMLIEQFIKCVQDEYGEEKAKERIDMIFDRAKSFSSSDNEESDKHDEIDKIIEEMAERVAKEILRRH